MRKRFIKCSLANDRNGSKKMRVSDPQHQRYFRITGSEPESKGMNTECGKWHESTQISRDGSDNESRGRPGRGDRAGGGYASKSQKGRAFENPKYDKQVKKERETRVHKASRASGISRRVFASGCHKCQERSINRGALSNRTSGILVISQRRLKTVAISRFASTTNNPSAHHARSSRTSGVPDSFRRRGPPSFVYSSV